MKVVVLFTLVIFFYSNLFAQSYSGTRANFEMVNTKKQIQKAVTQNAVVIYSTNTNELTIKINIAEIITGNKFIDSALQTLPVRLLVLKGNPTITLDQLNDENNNKEFRLDGQATFNDVQQNFTSMCSFQSLAGKADLKNTKFNFEVELNPNVFAFPVIADLCNYELSIEIEEGRINVITQ